jgi:hypothetical protein
MPGGPARRFGSWACGHQTCRIGLNELRSSWAPALAWRCLVLHLDGEQSEAPQASTTSLRRATRRRDAGERRALAYGSTESGEGPLIYLVLVWLFFCLVIAKAPKRVIELLLALA